MGAGVLAVVEFAGPAAEATVAILGAVVIEVLTAAAVVLEPAAVASVVGRGSLVRYVRTDCVVDARE